jgi:uncharacterized membrane protein YqjE
MKNKILENITVAVSVISFLLIILSNIVFFITWNFYNYFTGCFIISIYVLIILILIQGVISNREITKEVKKLIKENKDKETK